MEWTLIVFMVVFGFIGVISFIWNYSTNDKDNRSFSAFLLTVSAIIFFAFFAAYENRNTPTAMEDYRGKTTLEYKVVDDVKVDSVVIFKNDDYGK